MFENTIQEIKKALSSRDHITRRTIIQVIIAPVLFIWAIAIIIIGDWDANANLFKKWFYPNSITVLADKDVDVDAVSIQWKTDLMPESIEVYKNGELIYDDFREQEDNYFTVLYQGKKIAVFDQVKKKGIYGHRYHFAIKKTGNVLNVQLSIEGRDTIFTQIKND